MGNRWGDCLVVRLKLGLVARCPIAVSSCCRCSNEAARGAAEIVPRCRLGVGPRAPVVARPQACGIRSCVPYQCLILRNFCQRPLLPSDIPVGVPFGGGFFGFAGWPVGRVVLAEGTYADACEDPHV